MDKEERQSTRQDLIAVVFRRKWIIMAVFFATVIPVAVYTYLMPTVYESTARILVKPGRENIYVSPVGSPEGTHPPTIVQRVAEVINSEIQILRSRVLVRRVVEEIGLARISQPKSPDNSLAARIREFLVERPAEEIETAGLFSSTAAENPAAAHAAAPPSLETIVNRALANLSAARIKGTDVIEVTYRSRDPDVPAKFVSSLVDRYLERHLEVHQSKQAFDFFRAQSSQLEQRLASAARKLAEFKKKYNIVSFGDGKKIALQKHVDAKGAVEDTATRIAEMEKRIEKLKETLTKVSERKYVNQVEVTDPPVTSELRSSLSELELKKAKLLQQYRPESPQILNVDELIAKTKEMLTAEEEKFHGSVTTGVNATYQALESEYLLEEAKLEALKASQPELAERLIESSRELERLSRLEPELLSLERAVTLNEQAYKLYVTKFEESRVSEAMDAAKMVSASVIEPPTVPLSPVKSNKTLYILVSICLGGLAGLGMALFVEYFDDSCKVPGDIQSNLGVPVLGSIRDLARNGKGDLVDLASSPEVPPYYQVMKSNLVVRAEEEGIKMLAVSSPTSGEGSSSIALNLAATFVKDSACRVVLVDANLRQPSLGSRLKLPASPGLVDIVQDNVDVREAVKESKVPNLFVVTSGASLPNPMVIFESDRVINLTEALSKEFDWVIFDCAPAETYADASALVRRLRPRLGIVLVIQAENKPVEVALQAKNRLEAAGGKMLGAVLNRQRFGIS